MKPFSGCNCYYLLNKMSYPQGEAMVRRTLKGMREMGFNVIRMWAFDDGESSSVNLQCSPGRLNDHVATEHLKKLFDILHEVNSEIHPLDPPMMFMMTLTNYQKEYGGIGQYVSWQLPGTHHDTQNENDDDIRRKETFYTSDKARDSYDQYVKALIEFCKKTETINDKNGKKKKLIELVHSWDICNEPRCKFSQPNLTRQQQYDAVKDWIWRAAQTIRAADGEKDSAGVWVRPITVGLEGFFGPSIPGSYRSRADCILFVDSDIEGFFGPSSPGHYSEGNPYNNCDEGADWVVIGQIPEIDFMSIHLWPDKWKTNKPKDAIKWSEEWIKRHMEVCRTLKKPLCLQEYNISVDANADWARSKDGLVGGECLATSEDRLELFEKVHAMMKDPQYSDVLIGAMVWMIADHEHHAWDKEGHMITPDRHDDLARSSLCDLCNDVVVRCNTTSTRPADS